MSDGPARAGNLAPSGRRRRAILGVVALAGAVAAFLLLDARFGSVLWRAALLPPVFFAALCLFQAQAST